MSTSLIYHSSPLLLPRAAGALAELGGRLYDQIPEEAQETWVPYVNYALGAASVAVPIIGVLASVKVAYIALAALTVFVGFLFLSATLYRGSTLELQRHFCNWSMEGDLSKIAFAIAAGAHLNTRDGRNGLRASTALILAAERGHTSAVQMLVELGADPTIRNAEGRTALYCAAAKGKTSTVLKLIELLSFDINAQDAGDGPTLLQTAASNDKLETVVALLDLGADVNGHSYAARWTALMAAARDGHSLVVQELVRRGADLNLQNDYGYTALMLAASIGKIEMVRLLIRLGADLTLQDHFGNTARDQARNYPDIIQLLSTPSPATA